MKGRILVINSGSSSLKFKVFNNDKEETKGQIDAIGDDTTFYMNGKKGEKVKAEDHDQAIKILFEHIDRKSIKAVGHRVVHGGEAFGKAVRINKRVKDKIREASKLAPLHNPPNLKGILACEKIMKVPQVAVFDTAFHQTMEKKAYLYGIPMNIYRDEKIRKYGFHGTSHRYVAERASEMLGKKGRIITCHLGNGSSITAVNDNRSVDTSMGFTPTAGVMMGTRSGSIDPCAALFLEKKGYDTEKMLNKESGFLGIAGERDMRTLYDKSEKGVKKAQLTISMFSYHIAKYIGSYVASLNGLDALVFTGGIGEKAHYVREEVCSYLKYLGLGIDGRKNRHNKEDITSNGSRVKVYVIPTDEEFQIAKETELILG